MVYFKQEDFNKCMEFLVGKPDTAGTQQELYKFMHDEHIYPELINITAKNMAVYSKVFTTRFNPKTANWCNTMSDGSQVVWNRKYQEFYWINEVGTERCDVTNYLSMFPELKDIDKWLLESWLACRFQEMQKQLVAIFKGKYSQYYINVWR